MEKKIGVIFLIIFVFMGIFYFYINSSAFKSDDDVASNSNSNTKVEKPNEIGNVSSVKLYTTDYVYDTSINGYNYTEVALTNEQIDSIKKEVASIKLSNVTDTVIYGKYKLVLDDKVIFFDLDNDYALYLNENYVIKFSNDIKKLVTNSTDSCTCCTTSNCKINLCSCNTAN